MGEQIKSLTLWQQIQEDWIAHGQDWTLPGFRAIAIHRYAVWHRQIKSKYLRLPFRILYGILYRKMRNTYGIEIPPQVKMGRRVQIHHQSGIVIHANSCVGDDCIIRQGVTLGSRYSDSTDAPTLGKRVNIGAGAQILGKVTIGDDANIGANAIVLCDVPTGATAVGIPAKIISPKVVV